MKICAAAFCLLFLFSLFALTSFGQTRKPISDLFGSFSVTHYRSVLNSSHTSRPFAESGIKEIVPARFTARYAKWKSELLATEFGRNLWTRYEKHPEFQLKIVVTEDREFGAGTDDFKWNDRGELVGATVYLGKDLDKGVPDAIYYPVMNSLSGPQDEMNVEGTILASAKLAHELGHVGQTAETNGVLFQRQDELIAKYYKIFLKNGYDSNDPRLVELVNELGARPIEIWENREYWSEVSAMRFLVERLENDVSYCSVLRRIRSNLGNFAEMYRIRFYELNDPAIVASCS
jgi:hypothetical protein